MKIDLSGRIALVTGASGQLGRCIARTLAGCGAKVAIHYHGNQSKAGELLEEVLALGVAACTVQADVGDIDSVMQMRKAVAEGLGDPDIIVNNAVAQYGWATVLEQSVADYESQFRSCVLQNVLMAKAFVPAMIKKRWGRVIAISTECAMGAGPRESAYVSGKRGMDGVLRVLAREVGEHQITVNQVAPGWTISDAHRAGPAEDDSQYKATVPLRRRGEDREIASAVAFLASDLAAFITGAFLPVCGGKVMPAI